SCSWVLGPDRGGVFYKPSRAAATNRAANLDAPPRARRAEGSASKPKVPPARAARSGRVPSAPRSDGRRVRDPHGREAVGAGLVVRAAVVVGAVLADAPDRVATAASVGAAAQLRGLGVRVLGEEAREVFRVAAVGRASLLDRDRALEEAEAGADLVEV